MTDPMRVVSEQEIVRYERDGVVCLRGVLPLDWVTRMEEPLEQALRMQATTADMSRMARSLERSGAHTLRDSEIGCQPEGRFLSGVDHWRRLPDFHAFAVDSPLPALAAALMRAAQVYLYEDSALVKEPRTALATAFHQDLAYFHVDGEQICTFWCPLDPVGPETGSVVYVRGSHRWGRLFKPNLFVSDLAIPGTRGDALPAIRGHEDEYDLVCFEMQPGDVAVHQARTLHGAGGNRSTRRRRRAISVRYCGDDARHFLREGAPRKPHHQRVQSGDPLGGDDCPLVWPVRADASAVRS